MLQLLLASGSPRRKQLLEQVGFEFTVTNPDVDETTLTETEPIQLVEELAVLKGNTVQMQDNQVIVSADTVVSYQDQILTKPHNEEEAFSMLSRMRGQTHFVHTGVMIRSANMKRIFSTKTEVEFWDVSDRDLTKYIDTGEWKDKAAGYGIQAKGAFLVKEIKGDYYNVVGLPISRLVLELKQFDIHPY